MASSSLPSPFPDRLGEGPNNWYQSRFDLVAESSREGRSSSCGILREEELLLSLEGKFSNLCSKFDLLCEEFEKWRSCGGVPLDPQFLASLHSQSPPAMEPSPPPPPPAPDPYGYPSPEPYSYSQPFSDPYRCYQSSPPMWDQSHLQFSPPVPQYQQPNPYCHPLPLSEQHSSVPYGCYLLPCADPLSPTTWNHQEHQHYQSATYMFDEMPVRKEVVRVRQKMTVDTGSRLNKSGEIEAGIESIDSLTSISSGAETPDVTNLRKQQRIESEKDLYEVLEEEEEEGEIKGSEIEKAFLISDEDEGQEGPIRSKHELEDLPSVCPVEVFLESHHQTMLVGVISSKLDNRVIIEGSEEHCALNESSILWIMEPRSPLGIGDEIFGPVKSPYYVIRYNFDEEVPTRISVDEQHRRIIMDAWVTLSKKVGEMGTQTELLPLCWEQINHEEWRLLVAQSCGELAEIVRPEIHDSLILSIMQQLVEEAVTVVGEAVAHKLTLLFPLFPNVDKYLKVEELMFQLVCDSSGLVVETSLKKLVPAVVSWGRMHMGHQRPMLEKSSMRIARDRVMQEMRDVAARLAERLVALAVSDSALDVMVTTIWDPGIFDNVEEAIVGTMRQDGLKGFLREIDAKLCQEVPLYVAGMYLYSESKKTFQSLLNRELEVWETITVGAVSIELAVVVTTSLVVMKTRMMIALEVVPFFWIWDPGILYQVSSQFEAGNIDTVDVDQGSMVWDPGIGH